MALGRAKLCTKHKPRTYVNQCQQCQQEFKEKQLSLFNNNQRKEEETNDAGDNTDTVAE
jgi:hypothetical protein